MVQMRLRNTVVYHEKRREERQMLSHEYLLETEKQTTGKKQNWRRSLEI
jgi:ribosomal protein L39E